MSEPREFAAPKKNVPCSVEEPTAQYAVKKTGKNPAITVVANALFAQSYQAHAKIDRRVSCIMYLVAFTISLPMDLVSNLFLS
jgi:hypothetical protein